MKINIFNSELFPNYGTAIEEQEFINKLFKEDEPMIEITRQHCLVFQYHKAF